jgi:hypothetical protein
MIGNPAWLAAGAAGFASAMLALWAFRGLPLGTLVLWFAAAPIFAAGFGFGLVSAVSAAGLAALLVWGFGKGIAAVIYLALFGAPAPLLLAAGLRGIEKNYVLGPQAEDNVWTLTPEERRAMGYRELPSSLGVALGQMENSELVAEALGEHVFDYFLRNKRAEWEEYRANVTPFELKKYLSL